MFAPTRRGPGVAMIIDGVLEPELGSDTCRTGRQDLRGLRRGRRPQASGRRNGETECRRRGQPALEPDTSCWAAATQTRSAKPPHNATETTARVRRRIRDSRRDRSSRHPRTSRKPLSIWLLTPGARVDSSNTFSVEYLNSLLVLQLILGRVEDRVIRIPWIGLGRRRRGAQLVVAVEPVVVDAGRPAGAGGPPGRIRRSTPPV